MEATELRKEKETIKDKIARIKEDVNRLILSKSDVSRFDVSSLDDFELALKKSKNSNIDKQLEKFPSEKEPYFGRFDVEEEGEIESFYISKTGNHPENNIIFWKQPFAGRHYNGKASAENGLLLRRDLTVKNGEVLSYKDLFTVEHNQDGDEFISDAELGELLSKDRTSKYLQNIIRTIQANQNSIIRAPLNESFIVQGVAGSGKSVVMLHRLSVLKYNEEQTIDWSKVRVLVPNHGFVDYIYQLCEELDISDIKSETVLDYYLKCLRSYGGSRFGSCKTRMRIPRNKETQALLRELYSTKMYREVNEAVTQGIVPDAVRQRFFEKIYQSGFCTHWQTTQQIYEFANQESFTLKVLLQFYRNHVVLNPSIDDWFDDMTQQAIYACVPKLVRQLELLYESFGIKGKPFRLKHTSQHTLYRFELYAELLLYAAVFDEAPNVEQDRFLMIDEGQDHSPNEYKLFKKVNGNNVVFNIYGDVNQRLVTYRGIGDWNQLDAEFSRYELNENYRNPIQISEYLKQALYLPKLHPLGIDGKSVRTIRRNQLKTEIANYQSEYDADEIVIISNRGNDTTTLNGFMDEEERVKFAGVDQMNVVAAKGLQYPCVFVDTEGLSDNEKYVAFSRSYQELIIVEEDPAFELPEENRTGEVFALISDKDGKIGVVEVKTVKKDGKGSLIMLRVDETDAKEHANRSDFTQYFRSARSNWNDFEIEEQLMQYNVALLYKDYFGLNQFSHLNLATTLSLITEIAEIKLPNKTVVIGDIDIHGNLKVPVNIDELLQAAVDFGATKVIFPAMGVSRLKNLGLLTKIDPIFYEELFSVIQRVLKNG